MDLEAGIQAGAASPFVSTGQLPSPDRTQQLVADAHQRYRSNTEGASSQVYPALGQVPSHLFGV
jgi:glutaminase